MEITASQVAELRSSTNVGMMEAKNALVECGGDFDKAIDYLRKRGSAKAAKRADRSTGEGIVHCYQHNAKLGVMLELLCETDFVARNEDFQGFAHDVAMHIAAMNPLYVTREDVPEDLVEKEKQIMKEQMANEKKPEEVMEKIIAGKLDKYFSEICLMEQPFIKDEEATIQELLERKILSIGENIKIARFSRFNIGE